jgi:hypothetical protein
MALPSAYLVATGKTAEILSAIQAAQAPPRFTQKFLETLGFTSTNDRLIISVLKALGFLSDTGEPLGRYHEFLDRGQSKQVLADGIRQAYADLFQIKADAQSMTRVDVKNKMKTLSQGQYSDGVLDKMAATFRALVDQADFAASGRDSIDDEADGEGEQDNGSQSEVPAGNNVGGALGIKGLVYNINIHLPESRDPAVYDALFRSLRQHLAR